MEKNYYKQYYHLERKHWWFTARADLLMSQINTVFKGEKNLSILNIGVATGRTSELLSQFGKVSSIEFDKNCYDFVKENLNLDILNASILDLPFKDNTFDLVCAFDVIEHVEDDKKAVSEMRRVCKKEGVMFVSVPAFMFLWSEHDIINHHFRRYNGKILRGLFEGKDKPIFQSYFNFWLFFPIVLFRGVSNIFKDTKNIKPNEAKSDFDSVNTSLLNPLLYHIFKSENWFLRHNIRLPVGVSILSSWRKQ